MNTEQPQKWRLCKKKRVHDKFATIIIKFMRKFISGSIFLSIISVGLQPNGIPKSAKTFSWTSRKRTGSNKNKWPSATAKSVIYFWPTDLFVELVHSADMKMPEGTNVINVKSSLTTPRKWRIITATSAKTRPFSNKQFTSLLTFQKSRNNSKNGLMNLAPRESGLKTQFRQPKLGLTWA